MNSVNQILNKFECLMKTELFIFPSNLNIWLILCRYCPYPALVNNLDAPIHNHGLANLGVMAGVAMGTISDSRQSCWDGRMLCHYPEKYLRYIGFSPVNSTGCRFHPPAPPVALALPGFMTSAKSNCPEADRHNTSTNDYSISTSGRVHVFKDSVSRVCGGNTGLWSNVHIS